MKYFISYTYLTKSGTELHGNDVIDLPSAETVTPEFINSLEKNYEDKLDGRRGKLKLLSINPL